MRDAMFHLVSEGQTPFIQISSELLFCDTQPSLTSFDAY